MDDDTGIEKNFFKFLDLNFINSTDHQSKNINRKDKNEANNEHEQSDENTADNFNDNLQDPIAKILKAYKLKFSDEGKLLVCTECEIILLFGSFDYHFRTFHGVNFNSNERSHLFLALNQKYQSVYVKPLAYTELQEHLDVNLHLLEYIPGLPVMQGYRCNKCNLGERTVGLLHQSHRYYNILKCSEYKNFIKSKIQLICSDFKNFGHGIKNLNRAQIIERSEMKKSKLDDENGNIVDSSTLKNSKPYSFCSEIKDITAKYLSAFECCYEEVNNGKTTNFTDIFFQFCYFSSSYRRENFQRAKS